MPQNSFGFLSADRRTHRHRLLSILPHLALALALPAVALFTLAWLLGAFPGRSLPVVRADASISITKQVTPTVAIPGQTITYTLIFTNAGADPAAGVVITDLVPSEIGAVTYITHTGATITQTPGVQFAWTVQTLASGQGGVITIAAVLSDALPAGPFTNTAYITTTAVDNPNDNRSAAAVTVPPPDLIVVKTASPEPVVAGTAVTYTVVMTNQGPSMALTATLTDTLHPSITLQTWDQVDDDNDALGFGGGTHQNTAWVDARANISGDERLELADPLLGTGMFTSRVMDAGNVGPWTSLAWTTRRPAWKPLPDNRQAEEDYALGNADMVGNRVLLHMDALAGTTITDTSGLNHHGVCTNCPTANPAGRFSAALQFDGVDDTVVVSDTVDPLRYAIEAWVYPTGVVTDASFALRTLAAGSPITDYSHLIGILGGRFVHCTREAGFLCTTGTTDVQPDRWYHIVGTAESDGDIKLWVNGAQEGPTVAIGALWTGGDQYVLGSPYGTVTHPFAGRLDEVAIYTRTLSSGEILDHYLRGALRLSFQTRSCALPDCSDGTWSGLYSEQSNTNRGLPTVPIAVSDARYFQYRATLETDQPSYSPQLRSVRVWPDHFQVQASSGSCLAVSQAFTCTVSSLAPSRTITVTAYAHVHPSALGTLTNTAGVTVSNESNPANNTAWVTSTAVSEVRLSVAKLDEYEDWYDSDPVNPGSPMTYTLIVHNDGPSTAWDVVVTDTLPIAITGVVTPSGWTCAYVNETFTCTVPGLLPGTWPHISISGQAPMANGTVTNTAWITAAGSTVYTATSYLSDTETTTIEPLADLAIDKSADPNPVDPGGTLTFVISVTSHGPYTATGIVVTDTLSSGLIGSASGSGWSCGAPGNQIVCTYSGLLMPTQVAHFAVTLTAPSSGTIANHAVVASAITDLEQENNSVILYAAVRRVADLSIDKQAPAFVYTGEPITYTLTFTNSGPVAAGAQTTTVTLDNDHPFRIPAGGRAAPYRTSLALWGVEGMVRNLTITLHGLSHTYPGDLVVLLAGPGGRSAVLMASAGGGVDANDVTLHFNDAGIGLPMSGPLTSTALYRPTNYGIHGDLPNPAPDGPYGGSLSAFYGNSPNGVWRLYVYDTVGSDGGEIAGGWSLHLTAVTTDTVILSDSLPTSLTGVSWQAPSGWVCGGNLCQSDLLEVDTPTVLTIYATAPVTASTLVNRAEITSTVQDNDLSDNYDVATTTVVLSGTRFIYLPVVFKNAAVAPDLVVESLTVTANSVQVVIRNLGMAAVERLVGNEFWVDVYINPHTPPSVVNQTWRHVGTQGLVWGVTQDALPLESGQAITLTVTPAGGTYYRPDLSAVTWPLATGTLVYAQADSASTLTTFGAIRENHEIVGGPYNNVSGPVSP